MATKKQIEHAWDNAATIRGESSNLWRRDAKGNKMYKPAYGKGGETGWVVDHKVPKAKGGSDSLRNLQALNTQANLKKGAKRK